MKDHKQKLDAGYFAAPHGLLHEIRDRAEQLAVSIAECELGGAPVYIVLSSEIPDWPRSAWLCGLADPTGGVAWRREIGSRWRGPGVAMIGDRFALLERARRKQLRTGCTNASFGHFARQTMFEVTVHEMAHCLPSLARPAARTTITEQGADRVRHSTIRALRSKPESDLVQEPWVGHGAEFIRCAAHLAQRARQFINVTEDHVFGGGRYDLSPGREYASALRTELDSRNGDDLRDVLRSPAPVAFEELWQSDTAAFNVLAAADAGKPVFIDTRAERAAEEKQLGQRVKELLSKEFLNEDELQLVLQFARTELSLPPSTHRVGRPLWKTADVKRAAGKGMRCR